MVLASGITDTFYTSTSVTAGLTYAYKVYAINIVGLGPESAQLDVLAAKIPDPPVNV